MDFTADSIRCSEQSLKKTYEAIKLVRGTFSPLNHISQDVSVEEMYRRVAYFMFIFWY